MTAQEINNLINANIELVDEMRILKKENKDFQKRIEKSIELIELNICGGAISNARELLEILKGGDI